MSTVKDEKGLQGKVMLLEILLVGRTKDQVYPINEQLPHHPHLWVCPQHNQQFFFYNFVHLKSLGIIKMVEEKWFNLAVIAHICI